MAETILSNEPNHDTSETSKPTSIPQTTTENKRDLQQIDSAFALQEYLQSLIRADKDNLDALVELPPGQDQETWQYEHLRQLCLELNYLVVQLEVECTRQSCPEMKADEWQYLCAAHQAPTNCCAIDYIVHTLDGATTLLNSHKYFPSRISIPETSLKHYQSIARRLYRIFAHAWFHHREIFEAFEAYHSLFNDRTEFRVVGNMALLPIKTKLRGPPSLAPAPPTENDVIDEALDLFRANCLFRNFEIQGNADRVLIYLILFISDCLSCLGKAGKNTSQKEAIKILNSRALDNFALPGDPTFPLNALYASPGSDAARQELANRLVERVYVDGKQSKWWMSFQKKKFMNKSL
ncbi:18015_t:CDS:2 [Funneliformis geosporum]|uniref:18015_t:CDS:1 n=1 Tax=Funneliformis geosporum TaxID=1117311 RepID=A0A9W4WNQ5_9GLOM|nr:18015_t:CDS:2 [Funneliformis geosporum]